MKGSKWEKNIRVENEEKKWENDIPLMEAAHIRGFIRFKKNSKNDNSDPAHIRGLIRCKQSKLRKL